MKPKKPKIKPQKDLKSRLLNVSVPRAVLDEVGDVVSVLILEYIFHRFVLNDKKPVWLKIDKIHENIPYLSRAGLAKKLKKLVEDGHIIEKKGEGRHYHKNWYSLSREMQAALNRKTGTKVYYNLDLAKQDIEAAVAEAWVDSGGGAMGNPAAIVPSPRNALTVTDDNAFFIPKKDEQAILDSFKPYAP